MRLHERPTKGGILELRRWGASLVVPWLRLRLPVKGLWVQSLVRGTKIPRASRQETKSIKQKQ